MFTFPAVWYYSSYPKRYRYEYFDAGGGCYESSKDADWSTRQKQEKLRPLFLSWRYRWLNYEEKDSITKG